ncbi:MAG: acyl-CoA ligase (AMP-forming), exosortase A system-associated [Pseudomonadota bacterium]
MPYLLHHLVSHPARLYPENIALVHDEHELRFDDFAHGVEQIALNLANLGLFVGERVAIWLPKRIEGVQCLFAASAAGGVVVPINPLLKPAQVAHILRDSGARLLITQKSRLQSLRAQLNELHDLRWVILLDDAADLERIPGLGLRGLHEFGALPPNHLALPERTENDLAALLYTSGSTGQPKGVAVTHRNLLAGAASVAQYLGLNAADRLLAVLPFSFDYGLSQLTTAFYVGARVVLLDYLLPRDLYKTITRHGVSVLAGVPTLWHQLANQEWLDELLSLRILTNSGGRLPLAVIKRLRSRLPEAQLFLMYGLTEAFRSTYLPPDEVDMRPDSIGKAIPNARISVLREDGSPCAPHEIGELVHCGPTVARGYWNDPLRSAERFRPSPALEDCHGGLDAHELCVWSGDKVRMDEDGYLYFISRDDDMLKSSGYRISPQEIEDVLYASGQVRQAIALGLEDEALGERIVAVVVAESEGIDTRALMNHCRNLLPAYMLPQTIHVLPTLPLNPNGKVDKARLRADIILSERAELQ